MTSGIPPNMPPRPEGPSASDHIKLDVKEKDIEYTKNGIGMIGCFAASENTPRFDGSEKDLFDTTDSLTTVSSMSALDKKAMKDVADQMKKDRDEEKDNAAKQRNEIQNNQ